jgi:hypothetical protein
MCKYQRTCLKIVCLCNFINESDPRVKIRLVDIKKYWANNNRQQAVSQGATDDAACLNPPSTVDLFYHHHLQCALLLLRQYGFKTKFGEEALPNYPLSTLLSSGIRILASMPQAFTPTARYFELEKVT